MAGLFQGTNQNVKSYGTSQTDSPKWMQDAIYNQINTATAIANKPYEEYMMPTVAGITPDQQKAYEQVRSAQGAWVTPMNMATEGMINVARSGGQMAAAAPYMQQAAGMNAVSAAQPYMNQQSSTLAGLNYQAAGQQLAQQQNQYLNPQMAQSMLQSGAGTLGAAGNINMMAAAQPYMNQQGQMLGGLDYNQAAGTLAAAQGQYLDPNAARQQMLQGQQAYSRAGALDVTSAAQPFLQQAAQTSAAGIQQYMNPYQQSVMNQMARQSARNLSENLLPAVSDAFIRSGQFGGTRMGEFGSRALRDTQEALLAQQAQTLQQGYGQALSASQADLARQAQLASTAGSLTGQQAQTQLSLGQAQTAAGQAQQQAGLQMAQQLSAAQQQALAARQQSASQYGQMAGQAGQLAGQQMSNLTNLGQAQLSAAQAQQQAGLQAAQNLAATNQQGISQAQQAAAQYGQMAGQAGQLTSDQAKFLAGLGTSMGTMAGADQATRMSAYGNLAALTGQAQQLRAADASALEAIGIAQQQNKQQQLTAAQQQWLDKQNYQKQQADWMNTQIRGMAPITPQTTTSVSSGTTPGPSPLSQMVGAYGLYKGLTK